MFGFLEVDAVLPKVAKLLTEGSYSSESSNSGSAVEIDRQSIQLTIILADGEVVFHTVDDACGTCR